MKSINKLIGAAAAAALLTGVGVATLPADTAEAHTGDLNATAVCQTNGTYKVTYTLKITQTGLSGETKWRIGNTNFESTPTSNTGLDLGPVASNGAQTITLGTDTIPGTRTKANWAYAYTKWSDNFGKGSDGGDIALKGDCADKTPPTITVPDLNVTPPTCTSDGSLPFLNNPPAQNPNGYEFPGKGYRVYLSPGFSGPGTYTATIQKVGAGFDPAFPYGTKVTGNITQTLVVLAKLDPNTVEDCRGPKPPEVVLHRGGSDESVCVLTEDGKTNGTSTVTSWTQVGTQPQIWDNESSSYIPDPNEDHWTWDAREYTTSEPVKDEHCAVVPPEATPTPTPTPTPTVTPTPTPTEPTPTVTPTPTPSETPSATPTPSTPVATPSPSDTPTPVDNPTPPPAPPVPPLAQTGNDMALPIGIGASLAILAGLALVMTVRRRKEN